MQVWVLLGTPSDSGEAKGPPVGSQPPKGCRVPGK